MGCCNDWQHFEKKEEPKAEIYQSDMFTLLLLEREETFQVYMKRTDFSWNSLMSIERKTDIKTWEHFRKFVKDNLWQFKTIYLEHIIEEEY